MPWKCWALAALMACGPATKTTNKPAKNPSVVKFIDQRVDLEPYLESYPYSPILPIWDQNILLYDYKSETTTLHSAPIDLQNPQSMEGGAEVSSINWDTRTRWDARWHSDHLYFVGDEKNDEVLNLYRMDLKTGEAKAITDVPYMYGYNFSDDESRIAWLPRKGEGPFTTCLRTMAADGSEEIEHVCDTPKASFTWADPSWAPDGKSLVTRMNIDGKRHRGNLVWIQLDQPKPIILTDVAANRTAAYPLKTWLDDTHFVYESDESGFDAIGIYNLNDHTTRWLYTTQTDISHSEVVQVGEEKWLLLTEHSLIEDKLFLIDFASGKILDEKILSGTVRHLGATKEGQGLLMMNSAQAPFEVLHLQIQGKRLNTKPWLGLPNELQGQITQCDVQAVSFPTFDTDLKTGKPRQLHAYLYTPKNMTNAKDHLVRIKSFYGGGNTFDKNTQIFCEAGIVTFSPAVRGSRGFGTEFYRLNDGDLGGDEIADLFEASKWLVAQGYHESKIGLYGRSHGGYATMRGLTFPPGTNGHDKRFEFAFGLADAGFSDIISFYENCNIPDWVVLEAGDPAKEKDKLIDRSPITHVDKLQAPLFMSHGENDSRVPVSGSRRMNEACIAAKKACTYVEFPGQGHRVNGLANEQALYQARFRFLEQVVANTKAKE